MCRAWKNSIDQAKSDGKAEGILAGCVEGQDKERLSSIRNVMMNLGVSVHRAMEIIGIPIDEQEKYISMI